MKNRPQRLCCLWIRLQSAQRLDDVKVYSRHRAARTGSGQDVAEQRDGAVVTQRDELLNDRVARRPRRAERALQNGIGRVGPDLDDGPDGIALDLLIGVSEHWFEFRQRFVAAKYP